MADDVKTTLEGLAERRVLQRKEEAVAAAAAIQKTADDKTRRERTAKSWEIGAALIADYLLTLKEKLKAAEIGINSLPLAPMQNGKEIARHAIKFSRESKNVDVDLVSLLYIMEDGRISVTIKRSNAVAVFKSLSYNVEDFKAEDIEEVINYMLNIGTEFAS